MKKNKLVWRLGKLPSVGELQGLVNDKIITHEEAREILFNTETEDDRDKKSLQSEIKFLRDLVENLSTNRSQTITQIRAAETLYGRYPWYNPYTVWCGGGGGGMARTTGTGTVSLISASNFNDIKTF